MRCDWTVVRYTGRPNTSPSSGLPGSCTSRATTRQAPSISRARRGCDPFAVISRTASRSEEHTSELQSLMRISYAVFCLKKKKYHNHRQLNTLVTLYIYQRT